MSAAEVLALHLPLDDGFGCAGCGWNPKNSACTDDAEFGAHQMDMLTANRFAVVELPESDGIDDDGQEYFGEDLGIRVDHIGRIGEHHRLYVNGRPVAPETARNEAAELLLAANTAEADS